MDLGRSDDLLTAFGIGHLADRTFGTLSEGERKRVQLARSMMTDPEIVSLATAVSGRTNLVSCPNRIAVVDGAMVLGAGPAVVVGAGLEVGTVNVSMTSIGRAVDAVAP